jgi:hypothetical protein
MAGSCDQKKNLTDFSWQSELNPTKVKAVFCGLSRRRIGPDFDIYRASGLNIVVFINWFAWLFVNQ